MDNKLDRWVQTVTLAAMVALAATLVGLGLVFYAPAPHDRPPAISAGH